LIRREWAIGLAVAGLNTAVFAAVAPFFLNQIHHHWIVPVFCGGLLAQAVGYGRLGAAVAGPALRATAVLAALAGGLIFWRQFSMVGCVERCGGKLSAGILLLSLAFLALGTNSKMGMRRAYTATAGVLALWAAAVELS